MKKTTKRIVTIVISIVSIVSILAGTLFGVQAYATEKYWNTPISSDIESVYYLDDEILETMREEYDSEEKEIINAVTGNGQNLSIEYQNIINEINQKIVHYFKEETGIDVTDRLEKLNVKSFNFEEAGFGGVYGYFDNYSWNNTIYLYSELICSEFYMGLEPTYIHEVIHYLGSSSKGDGDMAYLYEGITETITEDLCYYEDILYTDDSSYGVCKEVAEEILTISPEIVKEIISGEGEFNLEAKLDKAFNSKNIAQQIENALNHEMSGYGDETTKYALQYLTCEYAKSHEKSATIELTKMFEIKWLLFR